MTDTTIEDLATLNRLAEEARHWRALEELREHMAELRARQADRSE
ncbi:hypothetical protein [Streptacidiphilus rugosus]|nr:hypothetical protein [Streptacidiphilus rugosus]